MLAETDPLGDNLLDTDEGHRQQFARLAIMMLHRLDVSHEDEHRIKAIDILIHKLGGLTYGNKEEADHR
jgi:hypothetical protein